MVQHAEQEESGAGHPGAVGGGRLRLHPHLRGEQADCGHRGRGAAVLRDLPLQDAAEQGPGGQVASSLSSSSL